MTVEKALIQEICLQPPPRLFDPLHSQPCFDEDNNNIERNGMIVTNWFLKF